MNGLALSASESAQPVVARYSMAWRSAPSSSNAQASVASPASAISTRMPAADTASRCRCERSFQVSLVSVYSMGHSTTSANPMWPTRTPRCVATNACPSSWQVLEMTSASTKPPRPASVRLSTTPCVKTSHWRATSSTPSRLAPTISASPGGESSGRTQGRAAASQRSGRISGTRMNR